MRYLSRRSSAAGDAGLGGRLVPVVIAVLWGGAGCLVAPSPTRATKEVQIRDVPRVLTLGIDARDYDQMVDQLDQSIRSDKQGFGFGKSRKKLALGPIDDTQCPYFFDPVTFAERLQTKLQRSDMVDVSFADSELKSVTALKARADIRVREWEKQTIKDEEMWTLFGEIASIDYLLFGRLSSQIAQKNGRMEVVYRFNWKVGDCRTGLIVWTDEKTLVKESKAPASGDVPEWVKFPRLGNRAYVYAIGESQGAATLGEAETAAELAARRHLVGDNLRLPAPALAELAVLEAVPQGRHPADWRSRDRLWVLFRCPAEVYDRLAGRVAAGRQTGVLWEEAKSLAGKGEAQAARAKLNSLLAVYDTALLPVVPRPQIQTLLDEVGLTLARSDVAGGAARRQLATLEELAQRYPLGRPASLKPESIHLLLSDCWVALGCPRRALEVCQAILKGSADPESTGAADSRITAIRADYTNVLFRAVFGGKRVAVRCETELDGVAAAWPKMQTSVEAVVTRAGGTLPGAPPLSATSAKPEAVPDGTLVFKAAGRIGKRPARSGSPASEEAQFQGTLSAQLRVNSGEPHSWETKVTTGWNPLGPDMCLDVLALRALQAWQTELARQQDAL